MAYFSVASFFWRIEGLHGLDDLIDVAKVEFVSNPCLEVLVVNAFFGIKMMSFANSKISLSKFFLVRSVTSSNIGCGILKHSYFFSIMMVVSITVNDIEQVETCLAPR